MHKELEYRKKFYSQFSGNTSTFDEYNAHARELGQQKHRRILTIIEEFSGVHGRLNKGDASEFDRYLENIGREGRKYGIHIIAVEQEPRADVFPSVLKSQMSTKICMSVSSDTVSRIIFGGSGKVN